MDNVAIVVDDLDAAIEFFTELGSRKAKARSKASGRTKPSAPTASGATSR